MKRKKEENPGTKTPRSPRGPGASDNVLLVRFATLSIPEEVTVPPTAGFLASGPSKLPTPSPSHPFRTMAGEVSFPVTVAGPRRILTGFPLCSPEGEHHKSHVVDNYRRGTTEVKMIVPLFLTGRQEVPGIHGAKYQPPLSLPQS